MDRARTQARSIRPISMYSSMFERVKRAAAVECKPTADTAKNSESSDTRRAYAVVVKQIAAQPPASTREYTRSTPLGRVTATRGDGEACAVAARRYDDMRRRVSAFAHTDIRDVRLRQRPASSARFAQRRASCRFVQPLAARAADALREFEGVRVWRLSRGYLLHD